MNNNLFLSSFISISIHAAIFLMPTAPFFINTINPDIIKAPASIEISMIQRAPCVIVKPEGIEEMEESAKRKAQSAKPQLKSQKLNSKESIGAITEQISSLMINKPPVYPALARIKGWEGDVVIVARINEHGSIQEASVLSGSGFYILDQAALEAIKKWHFRDVTKELEIKIPVKFILK